VNIGYFGGFGVQIGLIELLQVFAFTNLLARTTSIKYTETTNCTKKEYFFHSEWHLDKFNKKEEKSNFCGKIAKQNN